MTLNMVADVVSIILLMWLKADGKRHVLTLSIAGFLEQRICTENDFYTVIEKLIATTGKGHGHLTQVKYVYGKSQAKFGAPTIAAIGKETRVND